MDDELKLPGGYVTFAQAAKIKQAPSYHALRQWVYLHKVPCRKFGMLNVVRMSDLTGYIPQDQRVTSLV